MESNRTCLIGIGIVILGQLSLATKISNHVINNVNLNILQHSIDIEVDPCEDFYQYACGKWKEYHHVPEEKYTEMLGKVSHRTSKELGRYLSSKRGHENKPEFVKMAKHVFKSCMAMEDFDHLNYVKWMKENGNLTWPLPGRARVNTDKFDWINTLAILRRYGLNHILLEEDLIAKEDNPNKLIIYLDKPTKGENFQIMTREKLRHLTESMSIALTRISFETLWEEIKDIEDRLVELNGLEANDDDDATNPIAIKDLPFPWMYKYLCSLLGVASLDPEMEIYILNTPYVEALNVMVKDFKDYYICKYLGIRFLWMLHETSPTEFLSWECANFARSLLPLAMNWIYAEQHPELNEIIPEVQDIFHNIVEQFNHSLIENKMGFSPRVFHYLSAKLQGLQIKVGNIPRPNTVEILENFYTNLTLSPLDFYGNHLKLLEFHFQNKHNGYNPDNTATNLDQYFYLENPEDGISASAFYIPRKNIVMVPLAALRQPVYDLEYEPVFKYSVLGSILGHELFHAFDYTGLQINARGIDNPREYEEILQNPLFDENYQCLSRTHPELVNEKIADVSGLRYAFKAFTVHYPEAFTATRLIHGNDIELTKIFFLNFAQYYCDSNPNSDIEHGPVNDRVNDAISHLSAFSKVYHCPSDSRMNPKGKCQLWRR
ncbi:endothelin-converting enzyme-like 1 [Haematobia irritans]|uniref:endothelin-converting enzyme-like 1 n=1 Tax=Haematobia irritans TaxID=7368 RepID=UPI003F508340